MERRSAWEPSRKTHMKTTREVPHLPLTRMARIQRTDKDPVGKGEGKLEPLRASWLGLYNDAATSGSGMVVSGSSNVALTWDPAVALHEDIRPPKNLCTKDPLSITAKEGKKTRNTPNVRQPMSR